MCNELPLTATEYVPINTTLVMYCKLQKMINETHKMDEQQNKLCESKHSLWSIFLDTRFIVYSIHQYKRLFDLIK